MGLFTELDSRLFHEGKNYESYKKMGAHILEKDCVSGTNFAVWAPHAQSVSVMTSKTGWDEELPLQPSEADPGIWEVFVPGVGEGDVYRYVVLGADGGRRLKSDPYAFLSELRPANASIVMPLDSYVWNDAEHQAKKENKTVRDRPMAIYEVHLGSWKKDFKGEDDYMGFLNYRDLADQLAEYVKWMGFTHVELMGISEHPFDGSWGYQVTGFYSPNSRHGKPDDLRYLIDRLHQAGIQVILDFVPAHFPKDSYGLGEFDGSPLYESADPLRAEYPEWGTFAFDHGKPEVRSFLISSAFYWIREFHIDALRVDAVAAMLYASFSRYLWRPNVHGGNINLESEGFLKQLNEAVNELTPAYMIAEDSSTIAGITDPVSEGGIGFNFKWDMGWMNDTLRYIGVEPKYREGMHKVLTHTADYVFEEDFVLPLCHDEVVHLKKSLLQKAPGTPEEQLEGLKTLLTWQFTHPGKKLLFMGQEFGQEAEWSEAKSLDWKLADKPDHRDILLSVQKLLKLYKQYPCLYSDSRDEKTFEWVNRNDKERNILSFIRRNPWNYNGAILVICNFSDKCYPYYTVGVPCEGSYERIFSTCEAAEEAEAPGREKLRLAKEEECDKLPFCLQFELRPFEAVLFAFPG